jgi:hypothetical protein
VSESVIDIILKHKKDPVPELPEGLEEYQELLDLMMAKDRNDRFRDAPSLLHYVERLIREGVAPALPVSAAAPDLGVSG